MDSGDKKRSHKRSKKSRRSPTSSESSLSEGEIAAKHSKSSEKAQISRTPSIPKSPTAYDEFDVASRSFNPDDPQANIPEVDKGEVQRSRERSEEKRRRRSSERGSENRRRDRREERPRRRSSEEPRKKSRSRSNEEPRRRSRSRSNEEPCRKSRKRSNEESRRKSRSRSNEEPRRRSRSGSNEEPCRKRSNEESRRKSRSRSNEEPRRRSRSRSNEKPRRRHRSRSRDYRRERREIPGRRYWDSGRTRRSESEEPVIGDRFYGGAPKNRKENGDKENVSSNKSGKDPKDVIKPSEKRTVDLLTSKTGGAYIPPAKLRMMQAEITDKSSAAYQRIAWEALKKSIHGHINKVNTSNIGLITRELLHENVVRGRGLLARSIIQAQAASPTFTPVYAALTAVINSKFPNIGELLLKRLVNQFKRGFKRNDKALCISSGTFMSHLVNQCVAHEILVLQLLTMLVETPTDDSIEVAIAVLKECGMKLTELSKRGIEGVFSALRNTLHEGQLDKRVQYMIEVMFQVRKDGFKDHEAVPKELDLVEEEDQFTHLITLDEPADSQDILNVFKFDPEYTENEEKYKKLSREILDTDSSSEGDDDDDDDDDDDEDEEESEEDEEQKEAVIVDNTETNLTALRRTIYLTIQSSLDFEECAHKLMKMQLKPGQEIELCHMFLDCCAEMRTYEKFYGLLSGRFCAINKIYITQFEQIFKDSYDTIHRLDMNKLRNVAKFFAHLLFTDSISWGVLGCIKLNEDDTTSSGRVFIKILFQELAEYMGLTKLNARVKDVTLQEAFEGLFPRENPRDTRFAINFFTSIGLGGLTDDLREHLKNRPKPAPTPVVEKVPSPPSSSSSSSSSSSESSDSSSSSSSSSDEDRKKKKKKKQRRKIENDKSDNKKSQKKNKDKKDKKKKKK